mmetsp:Transcript_28193/g.64491  ORF Transcript_28193/g.64491 Transcript_28193/m.64491 type:complete len:246 (+) Transcript_28193:27-764(+)
MLLFSTKFNCKSKDNIHQPKPVQQCLSYSEGSSESTEKSCTSTTLSLPSLTILFPSVTMLPSHTLYPVSAYSSCIFPPMAAAFNISCESSSSMLRSHTRRLPSCPPVTMISFSSSSFPSASPSRPSAPLGRAAMATTGEGCPGRIFRSWDISDPSGSEGSRSKRRLRLPSLPPVTTERESRRPQTKAMLRTFTGPSSCEKAVHVSGGRSVRQEMSSRAARPPAVPTAACSRVTGQMSRHSTGPSA